MNTNCYIFRTNLHIHTLQRILLSLFLFLSFSFAKSQSIIWTDTIPGIDDQQGAASCFDASGNLIVVGQFQGTVTLNTILGPINISSDGAANDGLILKYDPSGKVIWFNKIGGTTGFNDDECLGVTADAADNIYVCGYTESSIAIFYGNGNPDILRTNNGGEDAYIAKYNSNGDLIWVITPTGIGIDRTWDVATDGTNVYAVGQFNNSLDFGAGPSSQLANIPGTAVDAFIVSYTTAGVFNWINRIEGNSDQVAKALDEDGTKIYATGYFGNNNSTFNGTPSIGVNNINNDDIWTACYNKSDGNVNWVVKAGGTGIDRGRDIIASANGVFTTGYFTSDLNIYSTSQVLVDTRTTLGNADMFLVHYDLNGVKLGVITVGGTGNDYGNGISFDANNDIYAVGTFEGTVNFGTGNITSNGLGDCFLGKYTSTLSLQSVLKMGSIGNDNITSVSTLGSIGGFTGYYNGGAFSIPTVPITPANPWVNMNDLFLGYFKCSVPNISCPTNITQNNDPGNCSAAVIVGSPTVISGCAPFTFSNSFNGTNNASDTYPVGTTTVTWTGTDVDGATTTCSMNIIITDNEAPVISCPGTITESANSSCQFVLPDYTASTSVSDNCGILSFTQSPIPGAIVNTGINNITLTATDVNGNISTCVFPISVEVTLNQTPVTCGNVFLSETTFGGGDTQNSFACLPYSTPGEDMFYEVVVPSTNYLIGVTITNFSDANDSDLDFLFLGSGCSSSACLEALTFNQTTQTFNNGNNSATFLAIGPGTYYFVVDGQTDGIDSYDISFSCVESGITFDNSMACTGDTDNDGVIAYLNGSASNLEAELCSHVTVCHDLYIANLYDWEWLDSVHMDLGSCYTNISNPTLMPGVYQGGNWVPTIDVPGNAVLWEFNHVAPSTTFGDGYQGSYTCANGETHKYTFCFEADISSTCSSNTDLNVSIYVSDDGVASAGSGAGSFDVVLIDDFSFNDSPPSFTFCPGNQSINNIPGTCGAIATWLPPTATDNCSVTVTQIDGLVSGSVFPVGTDTIVYLATDLSGQTDTCRFFITIIDIENPIINCPGNVSQNNTPGQCTFVVNGIAPTLSSDNCSVETISYSITGATTDSGLNDASGTAFNIGVSTVTYSAFDPSGNSSSCNFSVTIIDNEAPTISCGGNISSNTDPNQCSAVVNGIPPLSSSDNCTGSIITYSISGATTASGMSDASGNSFNAGVSTVTYTITDGAGNSSNCSFDISVTDNEAPTISCPGNLSLSTDPNLCSRVVNGISPTSSGENCIVSSITYSISGATTGSGTNDASGTLFNLGVSTVTYTITDGNGLTASCSFTITISDNQAPTINCPVSVSQNVSPGTCSSIVNNIAPISSSDNCSVSGITYSVTGATTASGINDASGISFNAGISTVTYTISDNAGNTASCSFTVTIVDNESPIIVCPGNVNQFNDLNQCTGVVNNIAPVSATDNCTISSITYSISGVTTGSGNNDASGTAFNFGVSIVMYTVTDVNGNSSSCAFTVTIVDNQIPFITCPGNVTQNSDAGNCSAIVNNISPTGGSDNCSGGNVTYTITGATTMSGTNDASGTIFNLGTSLVTYTITDAANNSYACNFTVTVIDNEAPIITCPSNQNIGNNLGTCTAVVNGISPTTSDNCSIASISYSLSGATTSSGINDASGETFNLGVTTVDYIVTDDSGNSSTCSFTVTVTDNDSPVISCPGNISVNNDPGTCSAIINGIAPFGISDNCSVSSVDFLLSGATTGTGINDASGINFNLGVTNIDYTVTDGAGNATTCSFTVTVIDNELPTITCSPNINTGNDIGFCSAVINGISPTSSDNCSVFSITYDLSGATTSSGLNDASGTQFNVGITTVTYTVTDGSSNTNTCTFTVTVNDTESPAITCPPLTSVNSDPGGCTAVVNNIGPVIAIDNCSVGSITYSLAGATIGSGNNDASGETFNSGTTNVTYTITDGSSNVSTCTFIVRVNDTVPPNITCPNDTTVNNDLGFCAAIVNDLGPQLFSDNCSVMSIDYELTGVNIGTGINDASGLNYDLGTTTITYTILDSSLNSNTCSFNLTIIDTEKPSMICPTDIFSCDSLVSWITPNATDNCGINSVTQISGLPSGSIFPIGITTIEYVAEDNSGNSDTCSFMITVYPPLDSTWTIPSDVCDSSSPVNLDLLVTGEPGGIFTGTGVTNSSFDPSIGAGTYLITYTTTLNGCSASMTNPITVVPSPLAYAGLDVDTCGLEAELNATSSTGVGIWSGNGITFTPSVNDQQVTIILPNYSTHTIYWTVDQSGICSVTDTILVTNYEPIIANAGFDQNLTYTEEAIMDANSASPGIGTWTGANNSFVDLNDPQTLAQNLVVGENYLYWTVVNGTCPPSTDEVIITIDDINIPDVITPNFDGKNDFFVINGIEFFGPVKIELFNRWGQIIYSNNDYQNDWSGQNSDGNDLPNDTYFYIITINANKTFQGYIVLKK